MIQGEKICLKPLQKNQIYKIAAWRNDPEIRNNFMNSLLINGDCQNDWYLKIVNDRSVMYFSIWAEDSYIGIAWLYNIDHINGNACIGILIGDKSFRKKGYGGDVIHTLSDYAFKQLNLQKLIAYVLIYNTGSLKVFQKNAYKIEGLLRKMKYYNLRFWDIAVLGGLKEEFYSLSDE